MLKKTFKFVLSGVMVLGLMPSMAFAAPEKNVQSKPEMQEKSLGASSYQEPSLKDDVEAGLWGDCQYEWNHTTDTITVKPGISGQAGSVSDAPWYCGKFQRTNPNGSVKHIIFKEEGGKKVILPENSASLFAVDLYVENESTIESIDLSGVDSSRTTRFDHFFAGCTALTSIDLSPLDTSRGEHFSTMFSFCESLTSLDVSTLNLSNATTLFGMFGNCRELGSIDLSNWSTSNVLDMSYLFYGCLSLTGLDLSSFVIQEYANVEGMFNDCERLKWVV